MYNFCNFVEYDNIELEYDHNILIWSKETGYFFTEYKNVEVGQKIIAREK